jgi:hypothetical protein
MRSSRKIILIAASALLAGGCAAQHPEHPEHPARPATAAGHRTADPGRSAPARTPNPGRFTVTGADPVEPNSSQDTRAQATSACRPGVLRQDQTLGDTTATGFALAGAPVAARLLAHFLAGTGTPLRFGPRSQIAREARASRPFRVLNQRVQAGVLARLRAGHASVRLPGSALPPVLFAGPGSSQDLYLGFRGTQGLDLSGAGTITRHGYAGTLTYVIRDSYGFPPADRLLGIGTAMRYLQVTCGSPQTRGGARWFPDAITVTVPFRHSINKGRARPVRPVRRRPGHAGG